MNRFAFFVAALAVAIPTSVRVDHAAAETPTSAFEQAILSVLRNACSDCHDETQAEAGLDLSGFKTIDDVRAVPLVWENILARVQANEMPPTDGPELISDDRNRFVEWVTTFRRDEAVRNAGDPGPVLARRLSHVEYDYVIRDLTRFNLQPTKSFPVDPANEAGFDNTAESLTMSPALMRKYLEASRFVAEHIVFAPAELRFSPHPVATDTDRDKYCVNRIVDFYSRQPTNLANYFYAAWRVHHDHPQNTLEDIAVANAVSAKYLKTICSILGDNPGATGPLGELQRRWEQLAKIPADEATAARAVCDEMADYVGDVRSIFEPTFENLHVEEIHNGAQCFVLWKNKQYARHRRTASFSRLEDEPKESDSESLVTLRRDYSADRDAFVADCERFCSVFPDAFLVSERGRDYLGKSRDQQEKGRLLSAGFHSMMGYFRDDAPLCELILDDEANRELDALWKELDFFTAAPMRQYQGFLWFERTDSRYMRDPEFDFARPEDLAALDEAMIERLAEVYTAKAIRNGAAGDALDAIREYFKEINSQIRWVETARKEAEAAHVESCVEFAQRAFRRPLNKEQREGLNSFYRSLREQDGLSHEEAIQDLIVSVLMSPQFLYRLDLIADSDGVRPLDDFELASRLSFFLWSSLPDEELLSHAASGKLRHPDVLLAQVRRMMADPKVRALATEFGGNWLDFRRFEEHNSVDRERFPMFNDSLRQAMFEEPIQFLLHMMQKDQSILECIQGNHTFVNSVLAKHYGLKGLDAEPDQWVLVEDAREYKRGGLLPMAVFLTKNAPGLRTSPVKRGYWVARRVLGERIPAPPPNVPELPEDESKLGDVSLRDALAMHRDHVACAGCHNRIDPIGLVFEAYGPVGELRDEDLGGRPVDTLAEFPDGTQRDGVDDLRAYIAEHRQDDFVDNVCRKLVSYALGRSLILPDELLVEQVRDDLRANGYRFSRLVEGIVSSPQFLNKRGRQISLHSE